ncbi:hypothetical protein ACHAXM_001284 [Skeletonema potamos]
MNCAEFARLHLPTFLLFLVVIGSTIAIVLVFSSSIHSLRTSYESDISSVNNQLRTIQSQQSNYQSQISTLTKLVQQSLNATDEYISNITSTLNKTETTITQDMATVQDIQDSQNNAMAVQFAGMFTILVILAEAVLDQCQMYAMQFVLLRPLTAIGWLISNQLFVPNSFLDWTKPQIYITIVTNGSIFFAFRGLVRFYHATREDLEWVNPWPKFLAIKGVVFMTFWQRMVISLIVNLGYSDKFPTQESATEFIMQAQNFLICLEMLFSAVAHCFIFSPDEWAPGYREREEARRKEVRGATGFGDSVALGDFINDIKVVMASKARRKRRKKRMRQQQQQQRGAALSPTFVKSEEEEEEDDGLELSSRPSSFDDDDDQFNSTLDSVDVQDLGDEDADWAVDLSGGEHAVRLADDDAPLTTSDVRRRLDTGSSAGSDGGDIHGSWSRIETFLEKHTSPLQVSRKEIV